jgi:beta-glucosidase
MTDTTRAPVDEQDLLARLSRLSLEQKVQLLTGADFWSLYPMPEAGLRRMVLSDGPAGVRGELWDERETSVNIPSPTSLASTWDEERVYAVGRLLATEARRKGVDVLLAPTVNLHRTPFGGRHFECLSEDPTLTGRIGAAFTRGLQSGGVAATVKHFVANDSETERLTVNAVVDERPLRELYLAPFETIVKDGGAWSVMAAYNQVNGATMTESPLIRQVLQDEWGFDGVTMSDWGAARSTVESGREGLDLVMPGPRGPWGEQLVAAVRSGDVPLAAVDDKVLRIMRLAARVGALDGVAPAGTTPELDGVATSALLRETAAAGTVLAHNTGILPLAPGSVRTVAVIGPNAARARTLGGGSATVYPPYTVSPLDGIRAAFGDASVTFAPGVTAHTRVPQATDDYTQLPDGSGPGVLVSFVDGTGRLLGSEPRRGGSFNWIGGYGNGIDSAAVSRIEVRTRVRTVEPGRYAIGASGVGRFAMTLDGEEAFDTTLALTPGADVVEALMTPPQQTADVHLDAGQSVDVTVTYTTGTLDLGMDHMDIPAVIQFNIQPPVLTDEQAVSDAVAAAVAADVVIVVVGTNEEVESEGYDRTSLRLPGRQDELVSAVAEANPRTVVVVNSGAPVLLPWADEVAAILLAWFPGQEMGHALADVLTGVAEPGGRLPTTWPLDEEGLPTGIPVDGQLPYTEGLFIGYRGYDRDGRKSRFAFGHGLGYTSWAVDAVEAPATVGAGEDLTARVTLRNTGERAGRTIVQVYAGRPGEGVERPVRWLVGFAAVTAAAGADAVAEVTIPARVLEYWNQDVGGWSTEPGTFHLQAGLSSAELPVSTSVEVRA